MSRAQSPGNIDQPEVCDDGPAVLQENVFGFEIFVDDALVVEVAHSLGNLLPDDDDFVHVEFVFSQMQVSVESVPLTEGRHYRQLGRLHAGSHEQHKVLVTGFPEEKGILIININ